MWNFQRSENMSEAEREGEQLLIKTLQRLEELGFLDIKFQLAYRFKPLASGIKGQVTEHAIQKYQKAIEFPNN